MSVHQLKQLEPDLRTHVLGVEFSPAWSAVLQSRLVGIQQVLGDHDRPHIGQMKYISFVEKGGIILLTTDGQQLVGVATIGRCSGLWSESFMIEDFRVAKRIAVMPDRVYEAMLNGILDVARLTAEAKGGLVLIHVGAATSERRLLRRMFQERGFQEEFDAPGMWLARVTNQDQAAA